MTGWPVLTMQAKRVRECIETFGMAGCGELPKQHENATKIIQFVQTSA